MPRAWFSLLFVSQPTPYGTAVSVAQAVPAFAVPQDGGVIQIERLASDVAAFEPGAAHPGPHPLDDQAAFKFCNRSDDDHDGAAERAGGIDQRSLYLEISLQVGMESHFSSTTDPKKLAEILMAIDCYVGTPTVRLALRLAPLVLVRPGELCNA